MYLYIRGFLGFVAEGLIFILSGVIIGETLFVKLLKINFFLYFLFMK